MKRLAWIAGVAGILVASFGGPLSPPSGAVTSTGRFGPRIEINESNTPGDVDSLYRITKSGSYYLPEDVTGQVGKHGIEIAADQVTIDLMGFELRGVAGSLGGIVTSKAQDDLVIRNGFVTAWGQDGIDLADGGAAGFGGVIESIIASFNGEFGIQSNGDGLIVDCVAHNNAGIGISLPLNGVVERCSARANGSIGIATGNGATVFGCSARDNGSHGFLSAIGGSIASCAAYSNDGNGILGNSRMLVAHNAAASNLGDGIRLTASNLVIGNVCVGNGLGGSGAGVHVTTGDNRIDGNNVALNTRGIDVDGSGTIILRNSASGNGTNYSISANNVYGPIVNLTAGGAPGVAGNAAASTVGTTDPWANFAY